jgi:hypothetical protein
VQFRLWIALDNVLSLAVERNLDYRDFFLATAAAYNGGRNLSLSIRALMYALEEEPASCTLEKARQYAWQLVRAGYSAIVLDCLGLPELYWFYAQLLKRGLRLAVYGYVNASGRTSGLLEEFQRASIREVAESLGGSKSSSLDRAVHKELSEPMSLEELTRRAREHLKSVVDEWVRQLTRLATPFFVISDHGYDFAREGEKMYLVHGRNPNVLSKLAPLLAVNQPLR